MSLFLTRHAGPIPCIAYACVTVHDVSLPPSLHLVQGPLGLDDLSQRTLRPLHQSHEARMRVRGVLAPHDVLEAGVMAAMLLLLAAVTAAEEAAVALGRSSG
jgi:hypothetical protein